MLTVLTHTDTKKDQK